MPQTFYTAFDTDRYGMPSDASGERDERTAFQRDRDRVIFSYAFRRLQSKTQVFQSGEYDFYRTRLTHSLEVARIARSIGEELNRRHADVALDGDLLEAVGLSHDLGHPPFGHIGERKLNEMMAPWGGFEGNAQTARILTTLFWPRKDGPQGMSPSRAFLDGTMKYKVLWTDRKAEANGQPPQNHFLYDEQSVLRDYISGSTWPAAHQASQPANAAKSLECQVMDWADDTAYSLHDIIDGVRAGYITRDKVEAWASKVSAKHKSLIASPALDKLLERLSSDDSMNHLEASFEKNLGLFLKSAQLKPDEGVLAAQSARYRWRLVIPEDVQTECSLYKKIALDLVFRAPRIQQVEFKSGFLIERMFEALFECHLKPTNGGLSLLPEPMLTWIEHTDDEGQRARLLCDYLAQLTDHEAIRLYRRLFDPDFGSITDLL